MQERPWYRLQTHQDQLVAVQIADDELAESPDLVGGLNAGYKSADFLELSAIGVSNGLYDCPVESGPPLIPNCSARSFSLFGDDSFVDSRMSSDINPASGLTMMDNCFDVGGNPYCMELDSL